MKFLTKLHRKIQTSIDGERLKDLEDKFEELDKKVALLDQQNKYEDADIQSLSEKPDTDFNKRATTIIAIVSILSLLLSFYSLIR